VGIKWKNNSKGQKVKKLNWLRIMSYGGLHYHQCVHIYVDITKQVNAAKCNAET